MFIGHFDFTSFVKYLLNFDFFLLIANTHFNFPAGETFCPFWLKMSE